MRRMTIHVDRGKLGTERRAKRSQGSCNGYSNTIDKKRIANRHSSWAEGSWLSRPFFFSLSFLPTSLVLVQNSPVERNHRYLFP